MKNIALVFFLLSVFVVQTTSANALQNLLACAPGEETWKASAICAASWGGCSAAANMVRANTEQEKIVKAFLTNQACEKFTNQLTGEGYDSSTFLGNAAVELAGNYAKNALNDDDESNDTFAKFLLVARAAIGVGQFWQCVDSAKNKCQQRWASLHQEEPRYKESYSAAITDPANTIIQDTVFRHFNVDSRCDVANSISFYADKVFFEKKDLTKGELMEEKATSCAEPRPSIPNYSIKNNDVYVTDFVGDTGEHFKVARYVVNWNLYNSKDQARKYGETGVQIVFRSVAGTPKIIGESHYPVN